MQTAAEQYKVAVSRGMPRRTRRRRAIAAAVLLWLSAAGGAAAAQPSLQLPGWDSALRLPEAPDINPDPRVVEVALEARVAEVEIAPGQFVEAWTYNGGIPGPLIRARVGDRLIVHFANQLPQPTTVHWHGLRVPIQMDGVPGSSQPGVDRGGTFTYDFVVPDAGLFWYHPHVMSAAQVGFGLYGALLVDDPEDGVGIADELVLVLSDLGADAAGTLDPPDAGGWLGTVFGREGAHVLVNGRRQSSLLARSGAPQRWRIVNAAKSRYFDLDFAGMTFRHIGGDGGLLEYAIESDRVVLTPGERADVIVTPSAEPGRRVTLRAVLFNRGFGSVEARIPFDDLVTVTMTGPRYAGPPPRPTGRAIEPLQTAGATAVDLEFTVAKSPREPTIYQMRGPLLSREDYVVLARPGETQVWTVTNKTAWSHPFHLHGFFFQVLDAGGTPLRPLAWKDTVNIPFEQTVRIVVRFEDRPGAWMFHCHVLDHAEAGLMGTVAVGTVPAGHQHRGPADPDREADSGRR